MNSPFFKAKKKNVPLTYFSTATYSKCDLPFLPTTESLRRNIKNKQNLSHLRLAGGGVGLCCSFQIDQNAAEDFNLTSDGEFNAIKSLVLGKVHGKEAGSGFLINALADHQGKQVWPLQSFAGSNTAVRKLDLLTEALVLLTVALNSGYLEALEITVQAVD